MIGLFTLALAAGIAANVLYFIADPPRLRAFGDLIVGIVGVCIGLVYSLVILIRGKPGA